jgi:hypothetical protein
MAGKPWEQFADPDELINQAAAKYGADPKLTSILKLFLPKVLRA